MNNRELAFNIIYKTISDESYSNLLMRKELNKVEQVSRAFITNLVNGVLRKYELLNYQYQDLIQQNPSLKTRIILCMAIYEKLFLNEKDYVVNNEYVNLCKNDYEKGFVNSLLHNINKIKYAKEEYINACLPEWLYKLLKKQYNDDDLKSIINIFQAIPNVYYRLNKKKCSYDDLKGLNINIINEEIFTSNNNLINTSLYTNGYFYIQDYNSASLYSHLDLKQDDKLLDVCSAPGSKLFNCLDIIDEKNAYANDLHIHRVELIKKMAEKLGYKNINYLNYDGTKLKDILNIKFNKIMLDAPCSGIGVIGRKPDLKFHIKPENLDELQQLQYNLLDSIKDLLEIDGILLYSTCTLNQKENSKQIEKFIKNNNNFIILEENTIINEFGDCFYYGKLKKVN